MDNLYQEATMPIEDVIAKYEANESGPDSISSTESPSGEIRDPNIKFEMNHMLKNPHVAALASSSEPKGISPFLRAKTASIDKNSECDESIAKEIDFKEGTLSETTNGNDKALIDSEISNNDDSNKDKLKHEVNGEHNQKDAKARDNFVSDSTAKSEQANIPGDKKDLIIEAVQDKPDSSIETNGEIDVSEKNNSNGNEGEKKVRMLI